MAADPRGFIPASDAANGIVNDLILHQECTEIERNILIQSNYGFLSTTITTTPMTSNAFLAPLTATIDTVHNTVAIPGLAAEVNTSCSQSLNGQPVTFSSTNLLPAPLETGTTYYLVTTAVTDVYQISTTKQNTFQCPPVVLALSAIPSVVTGTSTISTTAVGSQSILNNTGVPGTLVINGTSIPVAATDTLANLVAHINAAHIPNLLAAIEYTYREHHGRCDEHGHDCDNDRDFDFGEWNTVDCGTGYDYPDNRPHQNNLRPVIATAQLALEGLNGNAVTIGAGSTPALLTALGLTAGTFGEVGAAGNLIIDGHSIVISATDTLTSIAANINLALIPNVTAALSANNSSLGITDASGSAITIGGTSVALTALGFTAGTQQASVISATPLLLSELFYSAWTNVYFFPEQQQYVALMQKVIAYFQSVGYSITRQQQVDAQGNPIQAFSWHITWS
jgi:hypothetical protein